MHMTSQVIEEARSRLITRRSHKIERRFARPELLQIARGAYLEPDAAWKPWERRTMVGLARILWAHQMSPGLFATMESAALLHGLPLVGSPEPVHINSGPRGHHHGLQLMPAPHDGPSEQVIVRYSHQIPPSDITEVHGIRVVTLERLMLDMARFRPARESLVVADAALRRLSDANRFQRERSLQAASQIREQLLERLESMARQRGVHRAREVLRFTEPLAESAGESRMRWVILALGLPPPIAQKHVHVQGHDLYLDLWIEVLRLGFEYDGLSLDPPMGWCVEGVP